MRAKDLTGKSFGSLDVIAFDEERHKQDVDLRKSGKLKRVRRYYLCKCKICGNVVSVRGENLVSGNTKGCGCDMYKKTAAGIRKHNLYVYDDSMKCYIGKLSNSDNIFLVDIDDYDKVSEYCWYETCYGYAATRINKSKQVLLHRFIVYGADSNDELTVDHINRNRLDCRKSNLRECPMHKNSFNKGLSVRNKTGITGVAKCKDSDKWRAYIGYDYHCISLGYYDTKDEAVAARKQAESDYFGEYAPVL